MHWLTPSRGRATIVIAGIVAVAAAGAAYATAGGGSRVPSACVSQQGRELYLANRCEPGDGRVALGIGGPAGARGKTGRTGKAGTKGERGPAGAGGAKGDSGAAGPQGATGPQGAGGVGGAGAYVTATAAGPLSTSSSSTTDLGGPAVTVTVPASGLVEIYAGEASAGNGGHSDVFLYEDGSPVTLVECDGFTPGLIIADDPPSSTPTTVSTTGTSGSAGQCGTDGGGTPTSLTIHASSGSHTFKLEYAILGGPFSTTFTNSFLSVAPRP